jgi:hypothetical protein
LAGPLGGGTRGQRAFRRRPSQADADDVDGSDVVMYPWLLFTHPYPYPHPLLTRINVEKSDEKSPTPARRETEGNRRVGCRLEA